MANTNPYGRSLAGEAINSFPQPLTVPSFKPKPGVAVTPSVGTATIQGGGSTQAAPAAAASDPVNMVSTPAQAGVPNYQNPNDNLAMWGYTGEIPINNVEQQAIDFVNNMYATQGPLETMGGAQDYYNKVLGGEFGPEGQAYLQSVLDPMRSSAMKNYDEMSKNLATRFSNVGAYYGGKSGVAQGRLASDSANNMAQQEANLRYQAFSDDMTRRGGAASGLVGLGQAQSGVSGDMLNYLLSTGGMITGRDQTNRAEYQNALQRSYQDWVRARSEKLMPFQMASSLVGQQAVEPIVTQTQSPWGALLQTGGNVLGNYLGGLGGK
jgi:hypothetical protein